MLKNRAITESELIRQCKKGEVNYQEMLYKQFYGYAMGIARRYLANRDDALEVINDAFLKIFSRMDQFNEALPFKPWLGKVVVHSVIDHQRRNRKHQARASLDEVVETGVEPVAIASLQAADILRMLETLPELQRLVFNLYELDGYSHEEIGTALGIAESSSRVYLARAKERLRKMVLK